MSANIRSLGGAALMLVIIPVVVGLLACMPVPVGNPERSRIDPELNGVWRMAEDGVESGIYLFRPYDKRTWLVIGVEQKEDGTGKTAVYKAWLAKLGGRQFMTWEMAGGINADGSYQPSYWYVFRVDKDMENQVSLSMVDHEFDGFESIQAPDDYEGDDYVRDTRRTWERAIRKHVDDEAMYADRLVLQRLAADELENAADQFQQVIEFE
jgi:hypothetical protein